MSKVDLRLQCGMPCSKLEVSTAQHGTLSGAGYLHQSRRDIRQNSRRMVLSLSCRGSGRDGRLDFRLSAKRDVAAAKAFFRKAIKGQHDAPRTITLDGYAASHRAVRELKADGLAARRDEAAVRLKYLNNLIEQDHRGVKTANRHDAGLGEGLMTGGDYDRQSN